MNSYSKLFNPYSIRFHPTCGLVLYGRGLGFGGWGELGVELLAAVDVNQTCRVGHVSSVGCCHGLLGVLDSSV